MSKVNFVSTRELKNKTNEILHAAEAGVTIIVTRYGKPIATIRPYKEDDLQDQWQETIYQKLRGNIGKKYPQLLTITSKELQNFND